MRIGILGAGQLGRMLALEGYPLGHSFVFYDLSGSPTVGMGDVISDPERRRLEEFLGQVECVTYEFEHLPLDLVETIGQRLPLRPGIKALATGKNREKEKALFNALNIPTPAYRVVASLQDLKEAVEELGTPVVAKSITEGYDGKGQAVIRSVAEAEAAWSAIGHQRLIVEAFVQFEREISIIACRNGTGEVRVYPPAENIHKDGILRYSIAPAPHLAPALHEQANVYIAKLLSELDFVGVLALELFETREGLLANEIAPRVHNSGHWSIEGAVTSQFENHIRAVAGDPLGDTGTRGVSCMVNIIGEYGDRASILKLPYAHLHHYGKPEMPGRKLGHINVVADSYDVLYEQVKDCARLLPGAPDFRPRFSPDGNS